MPLMDVAKDKPETALQFPLEEVGLERVDTVALYRGQRVRAQVDVSVSLDDPQARGIHMSRLFNIVTRLGDEDLSWNWLNSRLDEILLSHQGLSKLATLVVRIDVPVLRPALFSDSSGWRTYPHTFRVTQDNRGRANELELKVLYSSACPCSTALSRQELSASFSQTFAEDHVSRERIKEWLASKESTVAIPHSQRSEAQCRLTLDRKSTLETVELIDLMESTLGTPVQAAVKREDEQEFARLNARNQMFCEDAARKLKAAFMNRAELPDFAIEVRHFESLHAHDVVARARKS